jgi:hypothetical protein
MLHTLLLLSRPFLSRKRRLARYNEEKPHSPCTCTVGDDAHLSISLDCLGMLIFIPRSLSARRLPVPHCPHVGPDSESSCVCVCSASHILDQRPYRCLSHFMLHFLVFELPCQMPGESVTVGLALAHCATGRRQ